MFTTCYEQFSWTKTEVTKQVEAIMKLDLLTKHTLHTFFKLLFQVHIIDMQMYPITAIQLRVLIAYPSVCVPTMQQIDALKPIRTVRAVFTFGFALVRCWLKKTCATLASNHE